MMGNDKKPPKTIEGKDFNPDEWEKDPSKSEPARGKCKGEISTETEHSHKKTDKKIL